ncbi:hypothetical protein ACFLZJ_01565 [Nanoarchaeota archaeon]
MIRKIQTKDKKAISTVVGSMLMIVLVVAAIFLVWTTVKKTINENIEQGEACGVDTLGKVIINDQYTCYNSSTGKVPSEHFQFSISIGDLDVDEVLIAVAGEGKTVSFTLNYTGRAVEYLTNYPDGQPNDDVSLPPKNGGQTYLLDMAASGFSQPPDSIMVSPIVNNIQCTATDSLMEIEDCQALI